MLQVNIPHDTSSSALRFIQSLSSIKSKAIISRASKRAAQSARKIAVSQSVSQYYISASAVRKAFSFNISQDGLTLRILGSRIGLEKFKISPGKRGKRHSPLKAAVKRGPLKPIPRAFIIPKFSNKAFRRDYADFRLPISKLVGPAIPQLIGHNPDIKDAMIAAAKDTFSKVLNHEISRLLGGGTH